MTTYNTGNPIGSKDPRDLYDNAENLDTAVNDTSRDTWSDRLGRSRKTMSGMEREFNADQESRDNRFNTFIASSGYQFLGGYAAGIEITEYNQIVRDADGEFWRLSGQVELPYVTTGAGLPEGNALTPLGDAVLRQDLANPDKGAAMVARGVVAVDSIVDLAGLPESARREDLQYIVKGFYAGTTTGGGVFSWVPTHDKARHNGVTVIDPDRAAEWSGAQTDLVTFFTAGSGSGCFVRLYKKLFAEDSGAVGDDVSDDALALNHFHEVCRNLGETAYGSKKTYYVSNTININSDSDFSEATIRVEPTFAGKAISTSATAAGVTQLSGLDIKYPAVKNNRAAGVLPAVGSVGIYIESMRNCNVYLGDIIGFESNLLLHSTTGAKGISYNTFVATGIIWRSKYNLTLLQEGSGWINQCTWHGGQWAQLSADTAAFTTTNLLIKKVGSTGNNPPNGHTFFGCSMEGNYSGGTIVYDLDGGNFTNTYASSNAFFNVRFEGAEKIIVPNNVLGDMYIGCIGFRDLSILGGGRPITLSRDRLQFSSWATTGSGHAQARDISTTGANFSGILTAQAYCASFGTGSSRNAGITGAGAFHAYNPAASNLYPRVSIEAYGGRGAVRFGVGIADFDTRLWLHNSNDLRTDASMSPLSDNERSLGNSSVRWSQLYAGSDIINTSDEREKQQVQDVESAALRAWSKVEFRQYKWNDAVDKKGADGARWHFGVMAQHVKAAFESEGLDPFAYGLLCYDEWEAEDAITETWDDEYDEDGNLIREAGSNVIQKAKPAGNRYGVRYSECLALECAYLRARLDGKV